MKVEIEYEDEVRPVKSVAILSNCRTVGMRLAKYSSRAGFWRSMRLNAKEWGDERPVHPEDLKQFSDALAKMVREDE